MAVIFGALTNAYNRNESLLNFEQTFRNEYGCTISDDEKHQLHFCYI